MRRFIYSALTSFAVGLLVVIAANGVTSIHIAREVEYAERLHQQCRAMIYTTAGYAAAVRALTTPPHPVAWEDEEKSDRHEHLVRVAND